MRIPFLRKNAHPYYWIMTLLLLVPITAIQSQDTEAFLRPYADEIVSTSKFEFVDKTDGKKYQSTKGLALSGDLKIVAQYLQWHYTSALVQEGLNSLGTLLEDESYTSFGKNYFEFVFENKEYLDRIKEGGLNVEGLERFERFRGIWDNGAMAAALIHVYEENPKEEYMKYLLQVADFFIEHKREGKWEAGKMNVDHLYTKCVFMIRMGKLTGETKYFDYCVDQILTSDRLFYDPATGLYDQICYPGQHSTNKMKWLRGMGWSAMALVQVLEYLPQHHRGYEKVLEVYHKHVMGISEYQSRSGLWRHLVNHPDSQDETSGSVFVVYAISRGINQGFLDPSYRDVAMAGWSGIRSKQKPDGSIGGSTTGVSSSTSPVYFLNFPRIDNSDHLMGPLFMAGAEMIKLYKTYEKPVPNGWKLQ